MNTIHPSTQPERKGNPIAASKNHRSAPLAEPVGKVPAEKIKARAFEIYQARARLGKPGDPTSDWLAAERELQSPNRADRPTDEVEAKARVRGERLLSGGD